MSNHSHQLTGQHGRTSGGPIENRCGDATPAQKRRRYQFTILCLLSIMTLASVLLSWARVTYNQYEREWQAARQLEGILRLKAERDTTSAGVLRRLFSKISGHDYHPVIGLGPGATWSDSRLGKPWMISDNLAPIRQLTDLRRVTLYSPYVTDESLAHLGTLPELEYVSVAGEHICGKRFGEWSTLTKLRIVLLAFTSVDDAAIGQLAAVESLEEIILEGRDTPVTDEGLWELRKFPKLRVLALADLQITDTGLAHLRAVESLRELYLFDIPNVTQRGVDALQTAMPHLKIVAE